MLHLSVCFTHLYASPACVHFQCASWSFTWLCASSAWIPDFTWMCAWPVCMHHLSVCFTFQCASPDSAFSACVLDFTWLCVWCHLTVLPLCEWFVCTLQLSVCFTYVCKTPVSMHPLCLLLLFFICLCVSPVCMFHQSAPVYVLHHICALYLSTCFTWLYASPVCVLNMSVSPVLMFYLSAYFICLCASPGCVLHMCVCVYVHACTCMCFIYLWVHALSMCGCLLYLFVHSTCFFASSVYIYTLPLVSLFLTAQQQELLLSTFNREFWNMLDCCIKMLHFFFYYYSVTLCLLPLDVCVSLPLSFSLICLNSSDFLCLPVCPMSLLLALSSPMFHTLTMAW